MGGADFELVLGMVERLSVEQRERLRAALADGDGEAAVAAVLEARLGAEPACLHCGGAKVQRWGKSHGLRRWRCRSCARSFNALTGTSLARLRKKAVWLVFATTLAEGSTVAAAAARCGVHPTTSFRWRHRFLAAKVARSERLSGIVEADETLSALLQGLETMATGNHPGRPRCQEKGDQSPDARVDHRARAGGRGP